MSKTIEQVKDYLNEMRKNNHATYGGMVCAPMIAVDDAISELENFIDSEETRMSRVFAKRLRYSRQILRELTQADLSEMTGIEIANLSRYESLTDKREPNLVNLIKIAKALKVTTDFLLGLTKDYLFNEDSEETP